MQEKHKDKRINKTRIAILAFEGISTFHLSVPCVVFKDAFYGQSSPFTVKVCAEIPGRIKASSCFDIYVEHAIDIIEDADLVIIPSWHAQQRPSDKLVKLIIDAHTRGASIAGLCNGAFALAATGLLNGKSATTHWAAIDDFSEKFPEVNLQPERLYIEDNGLLTSAGTAAALDCCLYMLKNIVGGAIANDIARKLVTAPYRSGDQKQYISLPLPQRPTDTRITKMMELVSSNLAARYKVTDIATHCSMSPRNFSRQFNSMMGTSFTRWLTIARLKYSQELLEHSSSDIAQIAQQAGFNSAENFRKHFKQNFSVSPGQWRQAFSQFTP